MASRDIIYVIFIGLAAFVDIGAGTEWSYSGSTGPSHWAKLYPTCVASRQSKQSPINIDTDQVKQDRRLGEFRYSNYDASSSVFMVMTNNGHTAQVDIKGEDTPTITGGGLDHPYRAAQLHFHWGKDGHQGSEHLLNGGGSPMEMHIVHYNTKYDSVATAATKSDGLAVLGFFFEISDDDNHNYDRIINHLPYITETGAILALEAFPLESLLPDGKVKDEFYRYQGSLTTPGCYESVTWSVFRDRITISEDQLNKFRNLKSSDDGFIVDNFRPPQPINDRIVTANFKV